MSSRDVEIRKVPHSDRAGIEATVNARAIVRNKMDENGVCELITEHASVQNSLNDTPNLYSDA